MTPDQIAALPILGYLIAQLAVWCAVVGLGVWFYFNFWR